MTVNTEPEALLSHLPKADGSATFSYAGYTIIGAVNGPIEVQRRDELPEEAAVDVIVRPAAGVGGKTFPPKVSMIIPLINPSHPQAPENDILNLSFSRLSVRSFLSTTSRELSYKSSSKSLSRQKTNMSTLRLSKPAR